jgi:epoxyqueuosine reductase
MGEEVMGAPDLSEALRGLTTSLGIDVLGFAAATEFHGYLLPTSPRRDPRLSLPDANTIIVAGIYIGGVALPSWDKPHVGRTSRLYLSGFFNDVVRQMEPLAALLRQEGYTALICDDNDDNGSIVPLKLAAIRAGLGWQGKNSLLVTKKYGTFLALGGIVTNAHLGPRAEEEPNRCKSCIKCQEACPTKALAQAHVLNRAKCLSYLMQHEGLPEEAKAFTENRVMDCEICQQACPWNAKHLERPLATAMTVAFEKEIPTWEAFFTLSHLVTLTEAEYEQVLGYLNTGVPYAIFCRNVLMARERVGRG